MPDFGVIDTIVAAIQSGDAAKADRLCRLALEREPDQPVLLQLLGICLQRQERFAEAAVPFARLTELCPTESMHWSNYATALKRVGEFEGAIRAAEKAIELKADDPELFELLGLLRLRLEDPVAARTALMRAHALAPDSPHIRIHAAKACVACRDLQADELLQPWREWLPLEPDLQSDLANLLTQVGEPWGAMELLEDLLRREPSDWWAHLLLAKVYERVNRVEEAATKLAWIIATAPLSDDQPLRDEVDVQRAQLAMRRNDFADARTLLEHVVEKGDATDGVYFSLAKACDRTGSTDAAVHALHRAHALQINELRVSHPELLKADAALLPRVDDRVTNAMYRGWPALQAPDVDQSPVFVVGFPRSGTTLLEQMLDAHPQLQSMDERPFFNMLANQLANYGVAVPEGLGCLDQRDCDELRKGYVLMGCGKVARQWDTRLVDKNPLNMLWLPMIQRLFPAAKFILAVRHPCDVIWSCYLQNFRAAPLAAACRSLAHLARAYMAAMENWLYHVKLFQPDVFVSRYEDLVADTEAQAARIAMFLGLEDAVSMLEFDTRAREKGFIRTPSYTQVVEPINARGVGHWHPYAAHFAEVLPIVEPMLKHWGYAASPVATGAEPRRGP